MNNQPSRASGNTPPRIELRPGGRGPGGPMGARLQREKPKNAKKTLVRLFSYIGRSRYILLALLLLMVAVTVGELFGPRLQQHLLGERGFSCIHMGQDTNANPFHPFFNPLYSFFSERSKELRPHAEAP